MFNIYKTIFDNLYDACEKANLQSILDDGWTYRVWLMPNGEIKTESVFSSNTRHEWTKNALVCVYEVIHHDAIEDIWDENGELLADFSQLFEEEFAEGKMYEKYDSVFDYILEEHNDEYVEYVRENFIENYDYDFYMSWVDWDNDYIEVKGEKYRFNRSCVLVPYEEDED